MKKFLFIMFLSFLSYNFYAQDYELSKKLIDRYNSGIENAKNSPSIQNPFWLSEVLREVVFNWDNLTDEAKLVFEGYRARPTFSGTEQTYSLGNFKFHFTTDSGYSDEDVPTTDNNSNGVPDYVDNMAAAFVTNVYGLYHTTTGLTVPPGDGATGGDAKYDVYISGYEAGDGIYGYVAPETNVGNNPNSPSLTEVDAYSSYMVMRNDYTGFGDPVVAMKVTAAHEYMHGVQFGYTGSMDAWFMEACATWAEDFAFAGLDDNFQYMPSVFGAPDVALNLEDGEAGGAFDGHWYGAWVFVRYLTEHTSNAAVKNIYERCISLYAIPAINTELTTNWSTNFDNIFKNWVAANVIMSNNAAFEPYTYDRAADYKSYINSNGGFEKEYTFNYSGSNINFSSQTNGNSRLMRLGYDWLVMNASQNFKITFTPSSTTSETKIMLLKLNTNNFELQMPTISGNSQILNVTNESSFTYLYPIVYRIDEGVTNTNAVQYTIAVTAATVGIEENNDNLNVYPNPADKFITINSNDYFVVIKDVLGKEILRQDLSDNNNIDVENFANGMYFVQFLQDNKIVKVEKIVISH